MQYQSLIFVGVLLITASAYAVDGCDEASKEWCEAYDLVEDVAAADKRLNDVYKKLSLQLSSTQKKRLVAAQRAWLEFRKLDCQVPLDLLAGIGSPATHRAVEQQCMKDRTEQRVRELVLYCTPFGNCK